MTKLKFFLLPAILLLGGLLLNTQPVAAQSQEEFEVELTQFASNHTYDEVIDYTSNRMASMTLQSYFEDYAELQLLGFFVGDSQCLINKASDLRQRLHAKTA